MSKVRVLFMGTPEFAVASLERMLNDEHFDIVAVVTQPDRPAGRKMQLTPSPVKQLALSRGLKVLTPESVNTPEMLDEIKALSAESAAVVAFGQILSQKFLDLFPHGCVNVHGSILPRWRGAAPIQRAIMAGDTESGVSLQRVVRKLDAGDVLGVRRVAITEDMDAMRLHDELKVLGADLLHIEYMDFLRGNLTAQPQDESLVTFAPKIEKSEARIDWKLTNEEINNRIRGLTMGPGASTERNGEMLKIHQMKLSTLLNRSALPGEIVAIGPESFKVACGKGSLEVFEVQPASRARMKVSEYIRGYGLKIGDRLG